MMEGTLHRRSTVSSCRLSHPLTSRVSSPPTPRGSRTHQLDADANEDTDARQRRSSRRGVKQETEGNAGGFLNDELEVRTPSFIVFWLPLRRFQKRALTDACLALILSASIESDSDLQGVV